MKVIYNTKEIGDSHNNYNRLFEKPLINSVELIGNITLNDINVYSKEEVKKLISSARSVKVALVLPSPLSPNTTYYIGPDMNGIYTVYLTDSSDPINAFSIGTTSFGKYYSGEGIDVTDPGNVVSVLVDSESVIVNSEGLMEARPVFEKMVPFNGATATKDGSKGIVPKPNAGDQDKFLFGDCTWKNVVDMIYPVGAIFESSTNPSTLFPGTSWSQLATSRALWTDATGGGGLIEAGMPNIYGRFYIRPTFKNYIALNGCFYRFDYNNEVDTGVQTGGSYALGCAYASRVFNASTWNSIYGKATTVKPKIRGFIFWRRTA